MNVNQVINHCLGLSLYPLQDFAGKNFNIVYDYIKRSSNQNPNKLLVPTIFICVAADNSLSSAEWDFIASFVGGYSYDQAYATACEFAGSDARYAAKQFADTLPYDVKEALICMCIAVLAVDKRLEGPEMAFLRSLL